MGKRKPQATRTVQVCVVCGEPIRMMIFKNTQVCSESCTKKRNQPTGKV